MSTDLAGLAWRPAPSPSLASAAVIIGRVTIWARASIWSGAVLRGDDSEIRIGAESSIQDNAMLHCAEDLPTIVGDRCTIGHLAHLEGAIIEDDALVGTGAIVLHAAVVGKLALGGGGLVPSSPGA